jgi:hypothetical protein
MNSAALKPMLLHSALIAIGLAAGTFSNRSGSQGVVEEAATDDNRVASEVIQSAAIQGKGVQSAVVRQEPRAFQAIRVNGSARTNSRIRTTGFKFQVTTLSAATVERTS